MVFLKDDGYDESEDFIVEVPRMSGFLVGDIVECIPTIRLHQGFFLRQGSVVKIDSLSRSYPPQDLLPLFFVVGIKSQVRSPLPIGSIQKIAYLRSKL
jgi:hypothetical protein